VRRLYFLVPDVDHAKKIVDELLLKRIEERHLHVIAKEGTPMADLPEARLAQSSDLMPALERGIAVGGATGLVLGIVAVTFPPAGVVLGGGAILATSLTGAGIGAIMAPMIGVSLPNSQLKQFEDAIAQGELLLMVDLPRAQVDEVTDVVKAHHPEAEVEGTEPTIPPFP
jgi:uncharacterized membrane protein